jgi:hypothetical protein
MFHFVITYYMSVTKHKHLLEQIECVRDMIVNEVL